MKSAVRFLGLVVWTLLLCNCARAQQDGAVVSSTMGFRLVAAFDRPGLPVPAWRFDMHDDRQVTYTSEHAAGLHALQDGPMKFKLSKTNSAKLGQLLGASHDMRPCETKIKGLARMGIKTLDYQPVGGPASQCAFNFTDNKPLNAASDLLIAMSYTIEQGEVLDWLHRYDRLGLDTAMTQLAAAAKDGHATEISAIRPSLQALVADDAVLDRVRDKAAALLQTAAAE